MWMNPTQPLPPPFMSTTPTKVPSWPSLYNPGIEILHIEHHAPIQPQGAYLYRAEGEVYPNSVVQLITPHKRHFPIHVVLDFNLLYPGLPVLRILCLLELCVPSISLPPEFSQNPRFNIPAFSHGSGITDTTSETSKAKGTTIKGDVRYHSLDDISRPRRSWCRCGIRCVGLRSRGLVQVGQLQHVNVRPCISPVWCTLF